MFSIGRMCMKLAGRDARKRCVVVDTVDQNHVLIDGQTRRKKCNMRHLEPLGTKLDIEQGADHNTVLEAFRSQGVEVKETTPKEKTERPRRQRKQKEAPAKKTTKKKQKKSSTGENAQ